MNSEDKKINLISSITLTYLVRTVAVRELPQIIYFSCESRPSVENSFGTKDWAQVVNEL